jgi:chitinase
VKRRHAVAVAIALTTSLVTAHPKAALPHVEVVSKEAKVVGYYTNWSTNGRNSVQVKRLHTSGAASRLTHVLYAFGSIKNGRCVPGNPYADYQKRFSAKQSVSGRADRASQALKGNINQLQQLKAKHPDLKVLWSFGGVESAGFSQAAKNPRRFATSCRALLQNKRWKGVFDGIDIDWEFPNACTRTCDRSGYDGYPKLLKAVRKAFGTDLVSSAIPGNGRLDGPLYRADYAAGIEYLDWVMPMTYDYFGTWKPKGPTAPNSPLRPFKNAPIKGFDATTVITALKAQGVPPEKILLGIPFYGRGWTGVTRTKPGGKAKGAARGPVSQAKGVEKTKTLMRLCPPSGTLGGTAYAKCGRQWWSYDTPRTIGGKMAYARKEELGGAFFWEFSGDTAQASLTKAIAKGLLVGSLERLGHVVEK